MQTSTTTEAPTTTEASSSTTTTTTEVETTSSTTRSTTTRSTTSEEVTSTSSSSSSSEPASTLPQSTRTTIVVVNGKTSTSVGIPSGTSLASNDSGSDGPSTGAVVGIVAGALLGVVVIAAIIGYILKKKRSSGDDEPSPFDRDEFRRTSAMLDDDVDVYAGGSFGGSHHGHGHGAGESYGGGHSPQMSEYSMRDLGRSNTTGSAGGILPGLARGNTMQNPRPPTAIMNHYNHQAMMPSFQPGQTLPNAPGAPYGAFNAPPPAASSPQMDLYGGYPISQHQQAQLDRAGGLYAPQHVPQQAHVNDWNSPQQPAYAGAGGWNPQMQQRAASPLQSQQGHLERGPSNASEYSARSGIAPLPHAAVRGSPNMSREASSDGHGGPRPLSLVPEDHEHHEADSSSRSGTPENANVQQTFFSHGREDSLDGGVSSAGRTMRGSVGTQLPRYEAWDDRQRRLSIRNGGLDRDEDDAYGGI